MDVWVALAAGVLGYFMKKKRWPVAPLALGFVLGPMLELSIRQSISSGGPTIFLTRPVALAFIVIAIAVCILPLVLKKKQIPISDEE
jgi:putative tricarboxylic transport membrane protein